MFSKVALVFTAILAAAAIAAPTEPQVSQCNTGPVQCCNSSQDAAVVSKNPHYAHLDFSDITGIVHLGCSPLQIVGIAGNSCSSQPVCCTGNKFNGLINVGCTPVNINL